MRAERGERLGAEVGVKLREQLVADVDEDDARERLLRVEARERRVAQKVAELARQLDARRAAADDEEGEDPAPLVVGEARLRRTLQSVAHRLPEAPRVLQPLEEEAVRRAAGAAAVAALCSARGKCC